MTIAAFLFAALFFQAAAPAPKITDMSWMAGCWVMASPSRVVTEMWLPPSGGTMIGVSKTVVKETTAEYEFLLLRIGGGRLEYVAKPSRQPEAVFTATQIAAGEAVFENPTHDFPTRITYRSVDGGLVATIDGTMNGKPRAIEFKYQRADCSK
jgi:hypothetical protein